MTYKLDSEHDEQVSLMKWCSLSYGKFPQLKAIFAIPNGGHRHITVASKMKAEGVKSGVPDLMLPFPSNGYNGLFIEMKRRKGGKLSDHQKEWRNMLYGYGYLVRVCEGWEVARNELIEYLTPSKP